jgi:hypothetical protein
LWLGFDKPKQLDIVMSILNFFIIKDVKTKKPSYTTTAFVYGFIVLNAKLILSGIQITETFKISDFSGVDYAAGIAAIGTVYTLRKNKTIRLEKEEK